MNDRTGMNPLTLSIAAVERDTGLSKDTLRVWERRYGFPAPARDAIGERAYPLEQVEKLRLVKRLMDAGHRPGRVVPMQTGDLQRLTEQVVDPAQRASEVQLSGDLRSMLKSLREHDVQGLRRQLRRAQARLGLSNFVIDVMAPLNTLVGDAWMRGELQIFQEHAYAESAQAVLRSALQGLPDVEPTQRPRMLLSTFPGEPHGLGLLMAEALCSVEGAQCLSLGVQTPLWDIVLAAAPHRSDVIALSFTGCMSPNQVIEGLVELRAKLPPAVEVWAGGSAPALHRRPVPGVTAMSVLSDLPGALQRWRATHPH